jgi:uncharacterized metal-binding protein YceD (DUF177 family)
METAQIKGVDSTDRVTKAVLDKGSTIVVKEKIMTHGKQFAKTEFEVELNGVAVVECDRCLDELEYPVEVSDTLYVKFSEEEFEFDGEVMWLNPADEEINLADYIYESLLLSLPYQRVHERIEDCNQEMIERFRIVSEEEFEEIAEPKEQSLAGGQSGEMLAALKRSLEEKEEN